MFPSYRWLTCVAAAAVAVLAAHGAVAQNCTDTPEGRFCCTETPEGRICTIQQRIINGNLVSTQVQQQLGLVTLINDCSGTLLNQFWVLTADHCLSKGVFGGAPAEFNQVKITATWHSQVVTPTRFVRKWLLGRGIDVALIYLGDTNFGPVPSQPLEVSQVTTGMTITQYGRGISAYAFTDASGDHQATRDNLYRSAQFTPSSISASNYTVLPNSSSQAVAGGDSGGPGRMTTGVPTQTIGGITGVASTCTWNWLSGHPGTWDWVTKVTSCTSAAVWPIRDDLLQTVQEGPRTCSAVSCGVVEAAQLLLLN